MPAPFLLHYALYLTSPAGVIATLVVAPILSLLYAEARKETTDAARAVPGCLKYGLRGASNLDGQYEASPRSGCDADAEPQDVDEARVKALFVYPIKSCRGVEVPVCEVTDTGLKYDRTFSFAQRVSRKPESDGVDSPNAASTHQWRFITQRECPKLALITTELWLPDPRLHSVRTDPATSGHAPGDAPSGELRHRGPTHNLDSTAPTTSLESPASVSEEADQWAANGGCIVARFPHEHDRTLFGGSNTEMVTLRLPISPTSERAKSKGYTYEGMKIWKDSPLSINMSAEIDPDALVKLQRFLGLSNPLGLFREHDENLRPITRSLPKDYPDDDFKVGFADAFPVHLLGLASARAIDADLPDKTPARGRLDAIRFRANIYTTQSPTYAEDEWMRIRLGAAVDDHNAAVPADYHVACRTARCTVPNVDPTSGQKDHKNEPHATLKRTRQVDEGAKPHPCLGLSMIPLFARGAIRVGDKIKVLETGEHYYEKMFS